ncbi:MAG TPA: SDR family oxidoreductase [Alphaproteobacteria bacterium]|nr:SDR family oxidoreductase [Alphaproteobacteria bacterium]
MSRVVLVTGGSRGIGRATCEAFLAEGATVLACGRTPPAAPLPAGVGFLACDVADAGAVAAMFAEIRARHGRLDVLVNNAGIAGSNRLDGDDALWHAIIDANLHGTYHCAKAALPLLPDGTGRIVNVSSVLGFKAVADQTAYVTAKHAVIGFTRSLALALAPRRITVNAVAPGWVATDMAAQRYGEIGITEAEANAGTPTGRITQPAEVAGLIAFLASGAAANMTGQVLTIDGGDTL